MSDISWQTIPAGGHFSARLATGEKLRIVDLHGQQAIDFLCYAAESPTDRYNAANTMKINGNVYLGKETKLYSDGARVLMRIVEDTCGRHDTIAAVAVRGATSPVAVRRTPDVTRISSPNLPAGRLVLLT
jgi:uncharacterized protein YcgI (DUF1989 family)